MQNIIDNGFNSINADFERKENVIILEWNKTETEAEN